MTGDLRQLSLVALTVSANLKAQLAHNFTNSCRVRSEGQVVFHVRNDYVAQQAQHFRVRKRAAD
jgi:hypothetical protein